MVKKKEDISAPVKKVRRNTNELQKLLGDEGALVMLYEADKNRETEKIVPREYISTAMTYLKKRSEGKYTFVPAQEHSRSQIRKAKSQAVIPIAKVASSLPGKSPKNTRVAQETPKSGKVVKNTPVKSPAVGFKRTPIKSPTLKKTPAKSPAKKSPGKRSVQLPARKTPIAKKIPAKAKTPLRGVQGTPGKVVKRGKEKPGFTKLLKVLKPKGLNLKVKKTPVVIPGKSVARKQLVKNLRIENGTSTGKRSGSVKHVEKLLHSSKAVKKQKEPAKKTGAKKRVVKEHDETRKNGSANVPKAEPVDPDSAFAFVFEPRPDRNPADMSRIVRRRSWSSASSDSEIETEEQTQAQIHSAALEDIPEPASDADVTSLTGLDEPPFPKKAESRKKAKDSRKKQADLEDDLEDGMSETASLRSVSSVSSVKASAEFPPPLRRKGPSILAPITVTEAEAREFLPPPSSTPESSNPPTTSEMHEGGTELANTGNLPPLVQNSPRSEQQRSSLRQAEAHYHYKELTLRKLGHVIHIVFNPVSTKLKNSFSIPVLKEFREVLLSLRKDKNCKVVLVTSVNRIFCQGVDLPYLVHSSPERCRTAAVEMTEAIKYFIWTLAHFPKPIVAGVEGRCIGLGAAMLPLFDLVYASDTATFCMPYGKLGQVPEGAVSLSFPIIFGNSITCGLLYGSRKLTATEAQQCGLVTGVLWPDQFLEELTPMVQALAGHASQGIESTKALLRQQIRTRLAATLENESTLLIQHWSSQEGQRLIKQYLNSDEVIRQ